MKLENRVVFLVREKISIAILELFLNFILNSNWIKQAVTVKKATHVFKQKLQFFFF